MSAAGETAGPRTRAADDERQRTRAALLDANRRARAAVDAAQIAEDGPALTAALEVMREAMEARDAALTARGKAEAAWRALAAEGGTR